MYRSDYNIRGTIRSEFERFHDFERADYVARTSTLIENPPARLWEFKVEKEGGDHSGFCHWYDSISPDFTSSSKFLEEPDVGKGTQCARIAKDFDFCHISVDDLLREEAKSSASPYRHFISESIKKSVLLSTQLTTLLLKQEMKRAQTEGTWKFLLDEFPRSVAQAIDFELKASILQYLLWF